MIVAQYPYPVVGGLERQAHELSKALLRVGHKIMVFSGKVAVRGNVSEKVVEGITVHRLPWLKPSGLRLFTSIPALLFTMWFFRNRYDVVHVHSISRFGACAVACAKLLGKPVLAKLPNIGEFGIPGMLKLRLGPETVKLLLRADAIVAMSLDSVRELLDEGYPPKQIFRVTNGVVIPPFTRTYSDTLNPTVMFSGRLSAQKGCLDLIAAWSQVIRTNRRCGRLIICGEGPEELTIRRAIAEYDLGESVLLTGHISDIYKRLYEADIFVLPSYAEGNSNSVLEAMATGLPIVSTNISGTPLLVGRKGSAFLFSPGDVDALGRLLLSLLRDPEKRKILGSCMRSRAMEHFSIDRVAARYSQAYDALNMRRGDTISTISSPVFEQIGQEDKDYHVRH